MSAIIASRCLSRGGYDTPTTEAPANVLTLTCDSSFFQLDYPTVKNALTLFPTPNMSRPVRVGRKVTQLKMCFVLYSLSLSYSDCRPNSLTETRWSKTLQKHLNVQSNV